MGNKKCLCQKTDRKGLYLVILLIFGFFCSWNTNSFAQKKQDILNFSTLRASVVKINITPNVPKNLLGYGARVSTGIHDSIYHRIIALDDGVTQFFLVSTEICLISPSEYDYVAARLQKQLGINPNNFWWTVTHTHSAPEVGVPGLAEVFMGERYKHSVDTAYTTFIEQTLFEGIVEARKNLAPAKIGIGWGFSQANINRRAVDEYGNGSIGLNPNAPVDRRIGLIRLDKPDGSPLALIANYPMHGTVLGDNYDKISGDAPGVVADYIEKKLGAPLVFINGAAGNLAPIYSVYPNPEEGHLSQFCVLLGNRILNANKKIISTSDSVTFFTGAVTIESPRKSNLGWPPYLLNYSGVTNNGVNMVKLPVRFLRINDDVAIWAAPIESFCEISNEIRDRSPFPFTFYFGYANGWLGYLPSEDEWKYGGYEVEVVSPFTPAMSRDIIETVTGYLQGEMRSARVIPPQKKQKH